MKSQNLKFEVEFNGKFIAKFIDKNDAIKFARSKKENYSWVQVFDLEQKKVVYAWIY